MTKEQLHYARMEVDAVDGVWELFAEDGEMRMYKREEEKDGLVVDPLKALHSVRGTLRHPKQVKPRFTTNAAQRTKF